MPKEEYRAQFRSWAAAAPIRFDVLAKRGNLTFESLELWPKGGSFPLSTFTLVPDREGEYSHMARRFRLERNHLAQVAAVTRASLIVAGPNRTPSSGPCGG